MKKSIFILMFISGCTSMMTPYETCQKAEEWKRHGTMDYCVADLRQKQLIDSQEEQNSWRDLEEQGSNIRKLGEDMQNNNPWGKK